MDPQAAASVDAYLTPPSACPNPKDRPTLDLRASCPPERLAELREIEIASTWRGLPEDRVGRARHGIAMLCDLMDHGQPALLHKAFKLFGERPFRVALHQALPGHFSPKLWNYWHLRLFGVPAQRPLPTVTSLRIACGELPADTPDPGAMPWPK